MNAVSRHNVNVRGKGETAIVFAHGYGCDQNMWRHVAPAFEDRFKTVLFDYVGHGNSNRAFYDKEKYADLAGFADDVLAICDELGLRDAIFVGHSVSAIVGILASLKDPTRFAKLVLVAPSPRYVNDADYVGGFTRADILELLDVLDNNHLGWSSQMAPVIMGNADRPELGSELANSFCRTDPEVAKDFARVTFLSDNRADLRRVGVPTLILQCANDAIAPARVGEFVHASIAGSVLVRLSATGHCPHLSAPAETVEAIRGFIEPT